MLFNLFNKIIKKKKQIKAAEKDIKKIESDYWKKKHSVINCRTRAEHAIQVQIEEIFFIASQVTYWVEINFFSPGLSTKLYVI